MTAKGPPPHPGPQISGLHLPVVSLRQTWFRSHKRTREPIHFGRAREQRFDDPTGTFGVLYAAADLRGAFVETFIRSSKERSVSLAEIEGRQMSEILFPEALRLVDLTSSGLIQLGADARLTTGDYKVSQEWALAFYQHKDQPDGILYCSRLDPSCRCVAIFERVRAEPSSSNLGSLADLSNRARLGQLLDLYSFRLL